MYVPAHFAAPDDAVTRLLAAPGAVDLVSVTPAGLTATTLPMVHDPDTGTLRGHLARNNTQWRDTVGEVLVIVRGPDAYVSPSWYATKAEHGRVVPTWDYVVAHVHGELVVHEDPEWLAAHVTALTDAHESGRTEPWAVDDAPERFVAGQLRAIVGVEVRIARVEAKWKLSQNRSAADVDGVVTGLYADGATAVADAVAAVRPPAHG
ncbi:FMN-binding negative transcriptional regulator [Modestobacter roseus]|uniref:PaiB family negative transcriptional regulator n=1 Tax=Modestobacter roseus TaxID=1181884 RepID=A0A562IN40_9ACTN|nr:FMN-binding negative transcriptional regulator [Modestobacter roseus]MQA32468.1 FMN-binding negative transcriptional regulator [Modestobacter roseus]TWH72266.1 PaiB family negative transcriptional regulator [Modestobacter roseus]